MFSSAYTAGAGGRDQQVKHISLADLARVKKTDDINFVYKAPMIIISYIITKNLNASDHDILITCLQNYFRMVILALSELESRLGLEKPIEHGLYCTVIGDISESKCALSTALTSYSVMALCYDRVGAEYNSCLTVNNARRFVLCGFLTTRSPNLTRTKVSLWKL